LDDCHPQTQTDLDSETALLLANIEFALRTLEKQNPSDGREDLRKSLTRLELALQTYGSVKHLLPKLNLAAAQRATVEQQLQVQRRQILAHRSDNGG
jgi:hypothetical protein